MAKQSHNAGAPSSAHPSANGAAVQDLFSRGSEVGRYVILTKVGSGGFGDVYAAYDPDLDRKIAVKIMKTRENKLGTAREQLSREAQALAKLSHKNVLTVYDFGDVGGDVFLAMEFVDGYTLKEWFAECKRTWQEVLEVMIAAGEGLAAAHDSGLVHSDFKPQNVLINRAGEIRVADFGLAKALNRVDLMSAESDADNELELRRETMIPRTREGGARGRRPSAAGSPAYMAPEQFRGSDVNEFSDQFSFAVTVFEGLYGRRPYPQRTIRELKAAVLSGAYDPPPEDSDVPRWVRDVVLKGISQEPGDRYGSMQEFLQALGDDPAAKRRRMLRTGFTLGATALVSAAIVAVLVHEPTNEELQTIESLRDQANLAAASNYYVMPPVDDPEYKTAYKTILTLEDLNGGFDPMADEVAKDLRGTFSATLTRIGDYYWSAEYGKTFALDYYMHAYMLDPSNERAQARASLTPGELSAAAHKAKHSSYTRNELIAAEPLSALAKPTVKGRLHALRDIKSRSRNRAYTSQHKLDLLTSVTQELANQGSSAKLGAKDFSERLPKRSSALMKKVQQAAPVPVPTQPTPEPKPEPEPPEQKSPEATSPKSPTKATSRPVSSAKTGHHRSSVSASEGVRAVMEGRALLGKAKFKEAAQAFHRALKANRRNSAALMGLSDTYFEMSQYPKAVSYGERAVAVNPRTASYRWKLGDAYVRILRYEDAIEQYQKGAKLGSRKAKRRLKALRQKLGEKR